MAVNTAEYKSVIGIKDLYFALVTQDDANGYVAGAPQKLAPVAELSAEAKTETKTQYADDIAVDVITSEGETETKVKVTGIPMEILALILGNTFDATTGRVYDSGGTPPYFALSFRSMKSNGKYRYYQYLKGRFSPPAEAFATKTDATEPKEVEITYTAIKTTYEFDEGSANKSEKRVMGDEDTANFSGANWFAQVQVPGVAAVDALALSTIVPADDATGQNVNVNVVLTFNNALAAGEENDIRLVTAAGVSVACTVSIDAARKVVTLNPDANLGAATVHIVTYAVKDIYGQTLAGSANFTTS